MILAGWHYGPIKSMLKTMIAGQSVVDPKASIWKLAWVTPSNQQRFENQPLMFSVTIHMFDLATVKCIDHLNASEIYKHDEHEQTRVR